MALLQPIDFGVNAGRAVAGSDVNRVFDNRNPLSWAIDLLTLPGAAVSSGLKETLDLFIPGQRSSPVDFFEQLTRTYGVGDLLRDFDVLQRPGETGIAGAIGFAGDVVLDPLSWLGAPGAKLFGRGGRKIAEELSAQRVDKAFQYATGKGIGDSAELAERWQQYRRASERLDEARHRSTLQPDDEEAFSVLMEMQAQHAAAYKNSSEYLSKIGAQQIVDEGIVTLGKRGGGSAALVDDVLVDTLVLTPEEMARHGKVSGLRVRWNLGFGDRFTQGGPQIMSQRRWSELTAPLRKVRGAVANVGADWRINKFFNAHTRAVARVLQDHQSGADVQVTRLAAYRESERARLRWTAIENRYRHRIAAVFDAFDIDDKSNDVLRQMMQDPSNRPVGIEDVPPKMLDDMGKANEQLRPILREMESVLKLHKLIDDGWGDVYFPLQLSDSRPGETAGRTIYRILQQRNIPQFWKGQPLEIIATLIGQGKLVNEDGLGWVVVNPSEFPWAELAAEIEEIERKLASFWGVPYVSPFKQNVRGVLDTYLREWGRVVSAKAATDALAAYGMAQNARDFDVAVKLKEFLSDVETLPGQVTEKVRLLVQQIDDIGRRLLERSDFAWADPTRVQSSDVYAVAAGLRVSDDLLDDLMGELQLLLGNLGDEGDELVLDIMRVVGRARSAADDEVFSVRFQDDLRKLDETFDSKIDEFASAIQRASIEVMDEGDMQSLLDRDLADQFLQRTTVPEGAREAMLQLSEDLQGFATRSQISMESIIEEFHLWHLGDRTFEQFTEEFQRIVSDMLEETIPVLAVQYGNLGAQGGPNAKRIADLVLNAVEVERDRFMRILGWFHRLNSPDAITLQFGQQLSDQLPLNSATVGALADIEMKQQAALTYLSRYVASIRAGRPDASQFDLADTRLREMSEAYERYVDPATGARTDVHPREIPRVSPFATPGDRHLREFDDPLADEIVSRNAADREDLLRLVNRGIMSLRGELDYFYQMFERLQDGRLPASLADHLRASDAHRRIVGREVPRQMRGVGDHTVRAAADAPDYDFTTGTAEQMQNVLFRAERLLNQTRGLLGALDTRLTVGRSFYLHRTRRLLDIIEARTGTLPATDVSSSGGFTVSPQLADLLGRERTMFEAARSDAGDSYRDGVRQFDLLAGIPDALTRGTEDSLAFLTDVDEVAFNLLLDEFSSEELASLAVELRRHYDAARAVDRRLLAASAGYVDPPNVDVLTERAYAEMLRTFETAAEVEFHQDFDRMFTTEGRFAPLSDFPPQMLVDDFLDTSIGGERLSVPEDVPDELRSEPGSYEDPFQGQESDYLRSPHDHTVRGDPETYYTRGRRFGRDAYKDAVSAGIRSEFEFDEKYGAGAFESMLRDEPAEVTPVDVELQFNLRYADEIGAERDARLLREQRAQQRREEVGGEPEGLFGLLADDVGSSLFDEHERAEQVLAEAFGNFEFRVYAESWIRPPSESAAEAAEAVDDAAAGTVDTNRIGELKREIGQLAEQAKKRRAEAKQVREEIVGEQRLFNEGQRPPRERVVDYSDRYYQDLEFVRQHNDELKQVTDEINRVSSAIRVIESRYERSASELLSEAAEADADESLDLPGLDRDAGAESIEDALRAGDVPGEGFDLEEIRRIVGDYLEGSDTNVEDLEFDEMRDILDRALRDAGVDNPLYDTPSGVSQADLVELEELVERRSALNGAARGMRQDRRAREAAERIAAEQERGKTVERDLRDSERNPIRREDIGDDENIERYIETDAPDHTERWNKMEALEREERRLGWEIGKRRGEINAIRAAAEQAPPTLFDATNGKTRGRAGDDAMRREAAEVVEHFVRASWMLGIRENRLLNMRLNRYLHRGDEQETWLLGGEKVNADFPFLRDVVEWYARPVPPDDPHLAEWPEHEIEIQVIQGQRPTSTAAEETSYRADQRQRWNDLLRWSSWHARLFADDDSLTLFSTSENLERMRFLEEHTEIRDLGILYSTEVDDHVREELRYRQRAIELFEQSMARHRRAETLGQVSDKLETNLRILGNAMTAEANLIRDGDRLAAAEALVGDVQREVDMSLDSIHKVFDNQQQHDTLMRLAGGKVREWNRLGVMTDQETAELLDSLFNLEGPGKFGQYVDKIVSWWRQFALLTPGWHVRNAIGGFFNNALAGATPGDHVDVGKAMFKFHDAHRQGRIHVPENDVEEFIFRISEAEGVVGEGLYGTHIHSVAPDRQTWNPLAGLFDDRAFRLGQMNRTFGMNVERWLRYTAGWSAAKNMTGSTWDVRIGAAGARINKFHFDYANLSRFEAGVLRNVMPFYTWNSRNLGLVVSMMAHRPQFMLAVERFYENIGGGVPVNPFVPEWYLKNQYRQLTPNVWSTLDLGYTSALRDAEKVFGGSPAMGLADLTPWARSFGEAAFGIDAAHGYPIPAGERFRRFIADSIPIVNQVTRIAAPVVPWSTRGQKVRVGASMMGFLGIPVREPTLYEQAIERQRFSAIHDDNPLSTADAELDLLYRQSGGDIADVLPQIPQPVS